MKSKVSPLQKALNLWAVILIVWAFYRSYFKMPVWFDEFIAKPLVFVLPVVYYVRKVDKKSFCEYFCLNLKLKSVLSDVIYSLTIGGVFFVTAMAASYFRTGRLLFFGHLTSPTMIVTSLLIGLATAVSEEILSRGFVLKKLYEQSKNALTSTFFSSLLFFFLHVPILFTDTKITGQLLLLFMATDMLLSMVNGLVFLQRKSLVVPILIHTFYNLVIALSFL